MPDETNEHSDDQSEAPAKKKRRRAAAEKGDVESAKPLTGAASSASLASCLTGLILLLLVAGTVLYVWLVDPSVIPARHAWGFWRLLLVGVLLIVIPIVVFRAVTLWIMGEGPRFVDIDFSWRAGIEAMAKQGLDLKSAPLFLVVGGGSQKLRKNVMAAVGKDFLVNGVPDRPAPLHWYVTRDAIYLFIDDAAWTNLAARKYRASVRGRRGRKGPGDRPAGKGPAAGQRPIISTLVPGAGSGETPTAADAGTLSGAELPSDAQPPGGRPRAAGRRPAAYFGTLSPDQVGPTDVALPARPDTDPPIVRRARPTGSEESSLQLRRLEAVCAKLKRHRQPVCPLNGVLVLLPFDLLQASRPDIEEVERALSADLSTAQNELQIRCPVTALVVAMEQERGFCELIRRIGRDHAAKQRFGQRFDIRREPTEDELRRFSTYVCGVFEDWVYTLFKEDKVLSHAGNPALYNLLCKVRRSFQARLSDVLAKGFGFDPQVDYHPLLFSGCYFAATGDQPEKQAFVSGVLSKLREEQEDLEWTDAALDADHRRRRMATIGWCVAAVAAAAIAAVAFIP